jgi:hypothetical protein
MQFHAKHNLGAFFAPQKTGLSGAPRFRAPAPTFGRKRPPAVAAPHPSNPLRSQHPGKPGWAYPGNGTKRRTHIVSGELLLREIPIQLKHR